MLTMAFLAALTTSLSADFLRLSIVNNGKRLRVYTLHNSKKTVTAD